MVSADSNALNDPEPEGFGSALVDEAARRDAALDNVDWTALPDGAVRGTFVRPAEYSPPSPWAHREIPGCF